MRGWVGADPTSQKRDVVHPAAGVILASHARSSFSDGPLQGPQSEQAQASDPDECVGELPPDGKTASGEGRGRS